LIGFATKKKKKGDIKGMQKRPKNERGKMRNEPIRKRKCQNTQKKKKK